MFIQPPLYRIVLLSCLFLGLMLGLVGCANKTKDMQRPSKDGHPPKHLIPKHLDRIPDAEPKVEPLSRYGNRFKKNSTNTYVALKKKYAVMPSSRGYKARGQASWYGTKFQGRKTSSGEAYDMFAMTAAHRTLPLPTYARVTNMDNGKSIIVKVNDRGPFHNNRLIDLSYVAAHKLGIIGHGTGRVEVESVDPRDHHGMPKNMKNKRMNAHLAQNQNHNQAQTQSQNHNQTQIHAQAQNNHVSQHQMQQQTPVQMQKQIKAVNVLPTGLKTKQVATKNIKQDIAKSAGAKPVLTMKGKVFLQLGAFNQKGNAEELAKKVGQFSSRPTQIAENKTQNGARYRVRIGPFNNREEAQILSQQLSKQEFPKPVVLGS